MKRAVAQCPLPIYTAPLQTALKQKNISKKDFDRAIYETAAYYYHKVPGLHGRTGAYNTIAVKLVSRYPCLECDDTDGNGVWVSYININKVQFSNNPDRKQLEFSKIIIIGVAGKI